jgi:hypothetical protein
MHLHNTVFPNNYTKYNWVKTVFFFIGNFSIMLFLDKSCLVEKATSCLFSWWRWMTIQLWLRPWLRYNVVGVSLLSYCIICFFNAAKNLIIIVQGIFQGIFQWQQRNSLGTTCVSYLFTFLRFCVLRQLLFNRKSQCLANPDVQPNFFPIFSYKKYG